MARLQRLHAAAGHLAEEAPEIIANPDAARGLEQALIEAMVDCLSQGEEREHTPAQGQHAIVVRPISPGDEGEEPGAAALYPGHMQRDQGLGSDIASMLPGAFGHESQALSAAAMHGLCAPGIARGDA